MTPSAAALVVAGLLVLLAGAAIGATSIGGVLVVPALAGVAGLPVGAAVAASSFAFLLTGLYGLRAWRVDARDADRACGGAPSSGAPGGRAAGFAFLHVAALAGAVAGALLVHRIPPGWVQAWVALLAFGSGGFALWTTRSGTLNDPATHAGRARPIASRPRQLALGAGTGLASALSGTGGPVVLLPMLLLLRWPQRIALSTAQAVQVPIALAASATHLAAGRLDWRLGGALGLALLVGAMAGHRVARSLSPVALRRAAGIALLATGLGYALQ